MVPRRAHGRQGVLVALGLTCGLAVLAIGGAVFKDGVFSGRAAVIGVLAMASGPLAYRWLGRRSDVQAVEELA